MIEKISSVKTKVLDFMDQEVSKYGNARMDVKEIGDLADIVKDLAEAEYYCTVAQSMGGGQGSMGYQGGMGYQGSMGYGGGQNNSMRSGYGQGSGGSMGHTDPMQIIRDVMSGMDPETRMKVLNELMR